MKCYMIYVVFLLLFNVTVSVEAKQKNNNKSLHTTHTTQHQGAYAQVLMGANREPGLDASPRGPGALTTV